MAKQYRARPMPQKRRDTNSCYQRAPMTNPESEAKVEKEGAVEASAGDIPPEQSDDEQLDASPSEHGMQEDSLVEENDGKSTEKGNDDESTIADDTDGAVRRTSLRTEALIHAAARAVVAKIENRENDSSDSGDNNSQQDERGRDEDEVEDEDQEDDEDDHDDEDDVFSHRSGRTSMGSTANSSDRPASPKKTAGTTVPTRDSPRVSAISMMSGISCSSYGEEDREGEEAAFVRNSTPRMPFRTPSAVRAIQMSSPTPSSMHGSAFPTVSRLGSPVPQQQYSPTKKRPTTPRFKTPRKELPLVLLHVTLLPLRWPWAEVLDRLSLSLSLSDPLVRLRDTWRALQDRVGDTVLERGVLLPHPWDDYEVLEERLLEALELPLLRRARLLECGHYLGYSNMMDDDDMDMLSESDDGKGKEASSRPGSRRHWCRTCNGEIKYESLGTGRVIRVKVYASNGLLRAGAWAACWKEMERVDVELEPILEPAVQAELEALTLTAAQEDAAARDPEEPKPSFATYLVAPSVTSVLSEPIDTSEARRRRDAERMREIYGDGEGEDDARDAEGIPSSTRPEPPSTLPPRQHDEFVAPSAPSSPLSPSSPSTSASPCAEAHERRERREQHSQEWQEEEEHQQHQQQHQQHQHKYAPAPAAYQRDASLPELLWEAVKVLMRDPRHVAVVVLAMFLAFWALGPSTPPPVPAPSSAVGGYDGIGIDVGIEQAEVVQDGGISIGENGPVVSLVTEASAASSEAVEHVKTAVETVVMRVQETVTYTETKTQTETQTQTQTQTETLKVVVTATKLEEEVPAMATAVEEATVMETEAATLAPVDEVDVVDAVDKVDAVEVVDMVDEFYETRADITHQTDMKTDTEPEIAASRNTEEVELERDVGPLEHLDLQAAEVRVQDEI